LLGDNETKVLAIFGPCFGDGFEMIDMADVAPWKTLKG
jgi:hypothetical protein